MRWWLSQSIKRMVAAALTLSIPVGANGQETTSTLDSAAAEARKAGIAEYRLGHFAEADLLLHRALEYAEQDHDVFSAALNRVALGDIYQAQGQSKKAEQIYEEGISVFRQTKRVHALAITLRNLAAVLTAQRKYKESIRHLEEASMLVKTIAPVDFELELRILETFGLTYFGQRKIDKALEFFKRSIDLVSAPGFGTSDVNLGQILNNLASVYEYKRQYRLAEDTYLHALRVTEEQFGRTHRQFVSTLDNLGYLYMTTGRYQEAEVQFRQSLAIAERSELGLDDLVIRTLHGLGKVHMKRNENAQAEVELSRALGIARASGSNRPEAAEILETYSQLLLEEARQIRSSLALTIHINNAQ
jgi:tetratricopeptide (TPR) repeat protein